MIKKAILASVALFFTAEIQANTVGLFLGGQVWQNEYSGDFNQHSTFADFNFKKKQQVRLFAAIEHPFPYFPNIRLSHASYSNSEQTRSMQESSFTDVDSNVVHQTITDSEIKTLFDIKHFDYTFYYQLLDQPTMSLDLGLTARDFSGGISITENITKVNNWSDIFGNPYTATDHETFERQIKTNHTELMLYLAAHANLPWRGFSLFSQGNFLIKSEQSIYDYQVGLAYELMKSQKIDFSVTLGFKSFGIEYEESATASSNAKIKGPFIGVASHF